MKIVHISDMHLTSPQYVDAWGERLLKMTSEEEAALAVITGDTTDNGWTYEYKIAKEYIDRMEMPILIVPGNHDARNGGFEIFEEMFGSRFPSYENDEVMILGLDSSEPDIDDGHIGRENYGWIREKLATTEKPKIIAMHHHLIPIPGTGRERHIPVDAGDFMNLCIASEVKLILSGHKHRPWIWKLENTYLVTAGTATTMLLQGIRYPSYNVLNIEADHIVIEKVNLLSGEREDIAVINGDVSNLSREPVTSKSY